jgi:hypothetical protein
MKDHLLQCGNKTVKCSRCSKYILRAIYAYHFDNNCSNINEENTFNENYFIPDRRMINFI